jgi:hypothetical protein
MQAIEKLYQQAFPNDAFKWYLLNDKIAQQYRMEMTQRTKLCFLLCSPLVLHAWDYWV